MRCNAQSMTGHQTILRPRVSDEVANGVIQIPSGLIDTIPIKGHTLTISTVPKIADNRAG